MVLSYVDVPVEFLYFGNRPPHEKDAGGKRWNKRQQQPREEGGYMYPGSSGATAAGSGWMDPELGAGSSSEPGRGSMDPAPGKAQKGPRTKGGREGVEQQQTRRRMEANETVEVDMRVNTAKIHVEHQETLLRQTSSTPWFLFNIV